MKSVYAISMCLYVFRKTFLINSSQLENIYETPLCNLCPTKNNQDE